MNAIKLRVAHRINTVKEGENISSEKHFDVCENIPRIGNETLG